MSTPQDSAFLEDDMDKLHSKEEFAGATLQIGEDTNPVPEVAFSGRGNNDVQTDDMVLLRDEGTGLSRDRPGSVVGRQSVRSTTSKTSMRPGAVQTEMSSKSFYSYKGTHFDRAIEDCKSEVRPDLDGDIKSTWLLTEIDHWDCDREKIVMLCENSIVVIKYNFINEKLLESKRLFLHMIKTIGIGDFSYPNSSLMPNRQHGGIQIRWDQGFEISFGQRWNPWCSDIPWMTFAHHPLIYNRNETETITYNVDEFFEALVAQSSKVFTEKKPGESLKVIEGPVTIESYASPISLVFNQSALGFFRDRNGVSF